MNKKLLTILFVSVFLIASIGFVSASDDTRDITVSISWDDNGAGDRPGSVSVSLVQNGNVVETKKLSESNSWSATFENQDADGSYSVKVGDISKYEVSTSGNAENGFSIKAKINEDVLGASNDKNAVEENDVSETPVKEEATNEAPVKEADNGETPVAEDGDVNTTQDENQTGDSNTTDNKTDNSTEPSNGTTPKETEKEIPNKDDGKIITETTTTKVISTIIKESTPKKPVKAHNTTHTLKNTGLPVALVLAAICAIFIPIAYRKK